MRALSTLEATRSIEPSRPAPRRWGPWTQDMFYTPPSSLQDDPRESSLPTRHLQRIDEKFAAHGISGGPAHDCAASGVDNSAAVNAPVTRPVLHEVSKSDSTRATAGEPSLLQIIVHRGIGTLPALALMRKTANGGSSHEMCHALTTDPKTQAHSQRRMDPGHPLHAT